MDKYIMALDQGTSSSRCIIFNKKREIVSIAQKELTQYYPQDGWVEHDANEIWESQISVAREAMKKINANYTDIAAIGITNQRETTVVWDKNSGQPLCNAIVWQCRRTAAFCDTLINEGWKDKIQKKCGLVIDAYFSATKLKWILDNIPNARQKAENNELLFGTIDTWLIWKLTKGKLHITDYSNASRTMMYNIFDLKWDDEILERFDIPKSMMPEVMPSSCIYGESDNTIFGGSVVLAGIAGDQQAALFGQGCYEQGMVKNTYGTGCFMLMNTGATPILSKNGLLTTIAWNIDGKVEYALEGSIFTAGAAVQWLRDELRVIDSASESEDCANKVENTGGVYVVPAFTGLGTPYWDAYARGTITGITRSTNKNHIVRAVLESMAYQSYDVLKTMQDDSGISLKALRSDGGASTNNFLMQFQADIIQTAVQRPACVESTAIGAAYLAGLAVGYWQDINDIGYDSSALDTFKPKMNIILRNELIKGWHKASRQYHKL